MKNASSKLFSIALCIVLSTVLITAGTSAGIDIDSNTPSMEGYDWFYDSVTHTLILDNANLQYINADGIDLDIKLFGKNTIQGGIEKKDSDGNSYLCGIYLNAGTLEFLESSSGNLQITIDGTETDSGCVKGIFAESTKSDVWIRGGMVSVTVIGKDVSAVSSSGVAIWNDGTLDIIASASGHDSKATGIYGSTQIRDNGKVAVSASSDGVTYGIHSTSGSLMIKDNGKLTVITYGNVFSCGVSVVYTAELYSGLSSAEITASGKTAYGIYLDSEEDIPEASDIFISGGETVIKGDTQAVYIPDRASFIVPSSHSINAADNTDGAGSKTVTAVEIRENDSSYKYIQITPKWIENLPFVAGIAAVVILIIAGLIFFVVKRRK